MLVIELQGSQNVARGLDYLSRIEVHYEPLAQDVVWYEERCTHCTACVFVPNRRIIAVTTNYDSVL